MTDLTLVPDPPDPDPPDRTPDPEAEAIRRMYDWASDPELVYEFGGASYAVGDTPQAWLHNDAVATHDLLDGLDVPRRNGATPASLVDRVAWLLDHHHPADATAPRLQEHARALYRAADAASLRAFLARQGQS